MKGRVKMIEKLKKQSDELESLIASGHFIEASIKSIEATVDMSQEILLAFEGISKATAPIVIAACEMTVDTLKKVISAQFDEESYKETLDATESCRCLAQMRTKTTAITIKRGSLK